MTDFVAAHAAGGTVDRLIERLAAGLGRLDDHTVAFVYATSEVAPHFTRLVAGLREATGIGAWVGTVGHGICATGTEHWGTAAAVVLACRLPAGSFELLPSLDDTAAAARLGPGRVAAGLGIVHGDPRNGGVTEIVAALARARGLYLVGGLSSANSALPQFAGDALLEGGVSGVLLGGRQQLAVGLTQGCSPVGPVHEVTRGYGQILVTLDNRPASEILLEDVGIAEGADPRPWLANVHAAIPVAGSRDADYVVRNIVGLDMGKGLVAIAESLGPGDRVMFVRRDREAAEKDLRRMLADLKTRLSGPPRAGLYYSCVARGPNLFDGEAYEMRAIRETFGDIPFAGFFGNGEISNDRVYAYTGVLTLFS